jgi:hypothetical protein
MKWLITRRRRVIAAVPPTTIDCSRFIDLLMANAHADRRG